MPLEEERSEETKGKVVESGWLFMLFETFSSSLASGNVEEKPCSERKTASLT